MRTVALASSSLLLPVSFGFVGKMMMPSLVETATKLSQWSPSTRWKRCCRHSRSFLLSRRASRRQTICSTSSLTTTTEEQQGPFQLSGSVPFAASRLGLDPRSNRFHAPVVYHERYSFQGWPEAHTFPMDKFARIAHALQTTTRDTHPNSPLPRPLIRNATDFFRPLDAEAIVSQASMHRWWLDVIDPDFLDRFLAGQLTVDECRRIGFREQTSRPELIDRTILEVAGTVLTCQLAVAHGIASNAAGGTHHAHPTMGAGYTILNDLAVAAHVLTTQHPNRVRRVLVVDCDVHQGDGTAKFHAPGAPLEGKLFTLSLHCASNYPTVKANSTFDVGLPDGMKDDEYLEVLRTSVEAAVDSARPNFVLYDAGVDVYSEDRLGRLKLSERGVRLRDRFVIDYCVSRGIPVATVVGGGYDKDVDALARRHALVIEEAAFVWRKHSMWKRTEERVPSQEEQ